MESLSDNAKATARDLWRRQPPERHRAGHSAGRRALALRQINFLYFGSNFVKAAGCVSFPHLAGLFGSS
jgi:hypothetical protein